MDNMDLVSTTKNYNNLKETKGKNKLYFRGENKCIKNNINYHEETEWWEKKEQSE